MKVQKIFLMIILALSVNIHPAFSQACAKVSLNQLESGVYELDLGNIKVKIETYNNIAKMKMIGDVNEDWTSVSTVDGISMISGYLGNGGSAKLRAQLVIKMSDGKFSFSIFKKQSLDEDYGAAYFGDFNGIKCTATTYPKWNQIRENLFPEIQAQSSINLEPDGILS